MEHTLSPIVTSSSVVAVKFDGGVMIAGDLLASYGTMSKYRRCSRLFRVNERTLLGSSGDYADYQLLKTIIEQRVNEEALLDDGFKYTPSALHSWLGRVLYNRRSRFDPLWNTFLVAGFQPSSTGTGGEPYLGYVDKLGVAFTGDVAATGMGLYFALPMLRDGLERKAATGGKLTKAEAKSLLERVLAVLYYRHSLAYNMYEIGTVTATDVEIEGPIYLPTDWTVGNFVDPDSQPTTLAQLLH